MTNFNQRTVILNSQNRLRNADSRAREWAIAHAGPYQGQARRELGGSDAYREWHNENLTIRFAKLATDQFKQVQLCSVTYELPAGSEPYTACVVTCAAAESETAGGYCLTVAAAPEGLALVEPPWGSDAGPAGLEKLVEAITADRARSPGSGDGSGSGDLAGIAELSVDDLFSIYNAAIVLTDAGRSDFDRESLAAAHGDWAAVVSISAAQQLALSEELEDVELRAWNRARIALFSRYAGPDGRRLRLVATDPQEALARLDEERDRAASDVAGRNALALLKILESVAALVPNPASAAPSDGADAASAAPPADSLAMQQRINTLTDQLEESEAQKIAMQERLAQYEQYEAAQQSLEEEESAAEAQTPESVADGNRHAAVLDAITDPTRFPRLRFLTNCEKELAAYGKPRPSGMEIVTALEAINTLAQAWYNTPGGSIGPWDNYFRSITGWKHADDESDVTMSRYGAKRSFSDQEKGRLVTITRHLTYQGSSSGLQIYFDRDDVTDAFIVGYIGEHLPYASSPS